MNDYISRQKAIEIINHYAEMALYRMLSLEPGSRAYLIAELQYGDRKHIRKMVEDIPPADIRPVVYGDWEWHGPCRDSKGTYWASCSVCKTRQRIGDYENFCPHCGADMRGEKEQNDG
jgi:hypothetical protein